ncbi:hypothetical protein BCR34DRAFT_482434 [Clohesyomyces aquaticus]|uniref:40S ribosomal protein S12 n=1 Tax=Clohesyomyces aquaticus TaxID=1231657 RepID=A0A1Y1ZQM4_9PLEO|nr:hypothetical protein BCR34DRAFT_482434 [Clohesyomyces aquaticus]
MAVESPHQPATLQQLTPPNSSHGGRGSWDYAVPMNNGKTSAASKPSMSEDVPTQPYSPRQPLAVQPNGVTKPPWSNTLDSQGQYENDPGYLAPARVNDLARTPSDFGGNGSDQDSLLEYYKNAAESKNGSRNASQTAVNKKKVPAGATWTQAELDERNWIHRDKLKEIETKELEEAGFLPVGRTSRANSRSQSTTRGGKERRGSEAQEGGLNGDEKRRVVSPIPAEDEDGEDDPTQWDLRTPEEIAAERELREITPPRTNNHIIRPSTSRIPIAKTSPAPVPHSFVERDAPLPRSRKGSSAWAGDAIATNGARVRSGSVSSQVMLDDTEQSSEHLKTPLRGDFTSSEKSPVSGSPPKAKTPGKTGPTGRKVSTQRNTPAKPRNASGTSPIKRPGTSGGSISRPTTAHRPEGDPPWIATMYKPDPRLPPDQQIIPTHAKRMQQEQWEIEGKHGSMYDRDFRLLNTDEFNNRNSQLLDLEPKDDERRDEYDKEWPLPSPTKKPSREPMTIDTGGTKSPTSEQGGYKLTPTIPQSPRVPSRASDRRPTISPKNSNANSKSTRTTRLPEPPAEEKQKKNCCCISDGEEPTSPVDAAPEVEVSADATSKGQMSVLEALKGVLKLALIHDGLARGLREASKALDRRQAHMCVLNEACEEEAYKKLVVALCSEHKIPLIKVPDGKQLGEWAGLCQIDREGNPRKVVNCSCVVVRDWGEESQERSILLNYFQTEQ